MLAEPVAPLKANINNFQPTLPHCLSDAPSTAEPSPPYHLPPLSKTYLTGSQEGGECARFGQDVFLSHRCGGESGGGGYKHLPALLSPLRGGELVITQ